MRSKTVAQACPAALDLRAGDPGRSKVEVYELGLSKVPDVLLLVTAM